MPKRRHRGIESKDFILRTGPSSKKRARLLEKLHDLVGRARFLAIREQLPGEPNEDDSAEERESLILSKTPENVPVETHTGSRLRAEAEHLKIQRSRWAIS